MAAARKRLVGARFGAVIAAAVLFVVGLGWLVLPQQAPSTAVPKAQRQADGTGQHHAETQAQVPRAVDARSGPTERDGRAGPKQDQAQPDGPKSTDVVQALSAAATTLFTGVLTWFAYRQIRISAAQARIARSQASIARGTLRETAAAAEAAKASADASRLALAHGREVFLSTERPWITVNAAPVKLFYNDAGCNINVVFVLKNVGKSPAANVFIDVELTGPVFSDGSSYDIKAIQRRISDKARTRAPAGFGEVVFPGDTAALDYTFGIGCADLDSMLRHSDVIFPNVVGCVGYSFVFEPGNHQTGFIYDVRRSDRPRAESQAKNRVPSAIFPDEGDIAQGDLMLMRFFMGWYAD